MDRLLRSSVSAVIAASYCAIFAGYAHAATFSWTTPSTGSWTNASLWSPAVVPNAVDADAVVDAAGGPYIVIASATNIELNSLTLNSPDAIVSFRDSVGNPARLTASELHVDAGQFQLIRSTLRNARVSMGTGSITSSGGTFEQLTIGSAASIKNTGTGTTSLIGLTLDNSRLRLSAGLGTVLFGSSVAGTGTIEFDTGSYGGFTINPSTHVVTAPNSGSGGIVSFGPGGVINRGTIEVLPGRTMQIGMGSGLSTGTLLVNQGTVLLIGGASSWGNVANNGGTILVAGPIFLSGQPPIELNTNGAGIDLGGGCQIFSGTVRSTGRTLNVFPNGLAPASLASSILDADVNVAADVGLTMSSGTLQNSTIALKGNNSYFQAFDRLHGTGTIIFDMQAGAEPGVGVEGQLGSGIVVRTGISGGTLSGMIGGGSGSMDMRGTVRSETPGRTLFVSGRVVNNGTMLNETGATLSISGTFTNNALIRSTNGTLQLQLPVINTGTIEVVGGTLRMMGTFSPTAMDTFISSNDAVFAVCGTLNGAGSGVNVNVNGRRLALGNQGSVRNATLLPGASTAPLEVLSNGVGTLSDVTAALPIKVNPGATLNLSSAWANNGSISATGQSTINIIDQLPNGLGAIVLDSSRLTIRSVNIIEPTPTLSTGILGSVQRTNSALVLGAATWMNAGSTLLSDAATATITVQRGYLAGGALRSTPGSEFAISGGTLESVTLGGVGTIGPLQSSITGGRLTLDAATITLLRGTPSNVVRAFGETTIDGTGEFIAQDGSFPAIAIQVINGTLTIGEGITFRSGNASPFFAGGGTVSSVVNHGAVHCDLPSGIGGTNLLQRFENLGLIAVGPGSTFSIGATLTNLNNRTFSGGQWLVRGALSLGASTISFDTNAADVRLIGPASRFTAADTLVNNAGTFAICEGRTFTSVGSLTNSGTFIIGSDSTLKASGTLTNSGTIDVNSALIANTTPRTTIEQQIATARNGGEWDQAGITSSTARAAFPRNLTLGVLEGSQYRPLVEPDATFGGLTFDDSSVLVKLTYYGDTDLNSIINFDDYARIDAGFNNGLSGWFNGDFDYSNSINFDDYALIDLAFNTQDGTILRALAYLDGSDRSDVGSFLNAVPEPGAALTTTGALLLFSRHRRARNF